VQPRSICREPGLGPFVVLVGAEAPGSGRADRSACAVSPVRCVVMTCRRGYARTLSYLPRSLPGTASICRAAGARTATGRGFRVPWRWHRGGWKRPVSGRRQYVPAVELRAGPQRGHDVQPQPGRVVIATVKADPGKWPVLGGAGSPLSHRDGLAETCRRGHQQQRGRRARRQIAGEVFAMQPLLAKPVRYGYLRTPPRKSAAQSRAP
jgi:hypothetical protein